METMKLGAMITLTGALLISCAENPDIDASPGSADTVVLGQADDGTSRETMAAVAEERQKMTGELRDLREDVEDRLEKVNERLARTDLDASTRKAVEEERKALIDLRDRIDGSLRDIEKADDTTWTNIKAGVRNTVNDVEAWFKKMGEKVDKETPADRDNDGH
jgi:predicted nuclease with TOPRIM domain